MGEFESAARSVTAGIDIGGTKIVALLVSDEGAVVTRGSVPAPASEGGEAMADAAAGLVRALTASMSANLSAAGVGAAGVVDQTTGTIRAASEMFRDWIGFRLGEALAERLGVPVRVENDVNAFLLGEIATGAAQGHGDVLGVMLGTGVGGALVLDGELRHGPHGAAGEIGHTPGFSDIRCTCGQIGHLETLASGTSLQHRYAERTGRRRTGSEIAEHARAGDADACAVFEAAGHALALACISAASLVDIDGAVIGGGVAAAWDLLEPAVERTLLTDAPVSGVPLKIFRGTLGADAVALGAATLVRVRERESV